MRPASAYRRPVVAAALMFVAALVAATVAAPAWAQDAGSGDGSSIAARVQFTREQFVKLTDQMLEVATMVETSEPQTARVLREAVSQARRAFIAEDMTKVSELLTQGLISAAATSQSDVVDELRKLLEMLRSGTLDLDDRLARLKQWQQALDQINKMLDKQKQLELDSRLTDTGDEIDKRLAELNKQLDSIVAEQEALLKQTEAQAQQAKSGPLAKLADLLDEVRKLQVRQKDLSKSTQEIGVDKLPLLGRAQDDLAGKAAKTAEAIGQSAKDDDLGKALAKADVKPDALDEAAKAVSRAAEAMSKAGKSLSIPQAAKASQRQQDAAADLAAAEKALSDMLRKAAGGSPSSQLADKQAKLAEQTGKLAEDLSELARQADQSAKTDNLDQAGKEMESAAGRLADQQPTDAAKHQAEALKQLKDEAYKLAQLRDRIKKLAQKPVDQQAGEQKDLADRATKTAENMSGDRVSESTPGQTGMQQAGEAMKSAGEKLDQSNTSDANTDQKEAIEKLTEAKDMLEEAIAREQEMVEAQQLAKIDQMLQKILDGQKAISASTKETYAARDDTGKYARPQQLKLAELSRGEGRLVADVRQVASMLQKEGSTVVFPEILGEIAGQISSLSKRLGRFDAGELTQSVQRDVEASLAEMIASIREELSKRRKKTAGGGGGGGGGGKKPPLVPPVAELKLLWRLQTQIAEQTTKLHTSSDRLSDDQVTARHKHLAERQKKIEALAKKMQKKLKASQEHPAPAAKEPDDG
jgi:hypothetical protein